MTTPTTSSPAWLPERAAAIASALGLPLDRLDRAGDPFAVPEGLRADYSDTLTGTPLGDLTVGPAPSFAKVHAAEQVTATLRPDLLAQLGKARGGGPVATSVRDLVTRPDNVGPWADGVLAEHLVDVNVWRQHVTVLSAAAGRHNRRAAERAMADQHDARRACAVGQHDDGSTRTRTDLPGTPKVCDRHDAALRHELARRAVSEEVRALADRLTGTTSHPTPADVPPKRGGLFR